MDPLKEIFDQMEITVIERALTTLVTTRQLGFCAAKIYRHFDCQKHPECCNIYAFYRVNLLLFEKRMVMAETTFSLPNSSPEYCYRFQLPEDFFYAADSVSLYPAMVGNFLSVLGPFSAGGYIIPAFCVNRVVRHQEGRFCPMSEQVTLSNLRKVVESLADANLSLPVRKAFYEHNPIPGAKWEGGPDNPILRNPDEIMPENYTISQLKDDIRGYNNLCITLEKMGLLLCSKIDFLQEGSISMLMSNEQENLRCRDRKPHETLEDYYTHISLEGDVRNFWSSRSMGKTDKLRGQVNLAGELPVLNNYIHNDPSFLLVENGMEAEENFIYPHYTIRSRCCAGRLYETSHRGIINILFNELLHD